MWAILAAPLMISDDLTRISAASRTAIANGEVIAIDQDPGGVQGTLVSSAGAGEVWAKPLADGSRAVALLNRGSSPVRLRTSGSTVGLPAAGRYLVRDVWRHDGRLTAGPISLEVPAQSTVLLRVSVSG
jgi:alpha-galactosidase